MTPGGGVIVHAIQLAIAPVFLLSGIAALLGVMANRLARIIDRARMLEQTWAGLDETTRAANAIGSGLSRASASLGKLVDQFLHWRGVAAMYRHNYALC